MRTGISIGERFGGLFEIDPRTKPTVFLQVYDGADLFNWNYWVELLLSAAIATLGLLLNSPAVVIGAMLISPLMGPITASGMGIAVADFYLHIKANVQLFLSAVAVLGFGAIMLWALGYNAQTSELLARTSPNLLDLAIALFSGLAGAMVAVRSQTRKGGGISALPGVAVAVALMPPLCALGVGLARNFDWSVANGAGLLFITNALAIEASAFFIFLLAGLGDPDVRKALKEPLAERRARDPLYQFLFYHTRILQFMQRFKSLSLRLLIVGTGLLLVSWPLWESFGELSRDLKVRRAIRVARRIMNIAPQHLIQEHTFQGLSESPLLVQLVVTHWVSPESVEKAEAYVRGATGLKTDIHVGTVLDVESTSQTQDQPPGGPRTQRNLGDLQKQLMASFDETVRSLWPKGPARIQNCELHLSSKGTELRIDYVTEGTGLDEAAAGILRNGLRRLLDSPELTLRLQRVERAKGDEH